MYLWANVSEYTEIYGLSWNVEKMSRNIIGPGGKLLFFACSHDMFLDASRVSKSDRKSCKSNNNLLYTPPPSCILRTFSFSLNLRLS